MNSTFKYMSKDSRKYFINKYGTVQELRSTFSNIKSINIDFSLAWFLSLYVDL